MKIRLLKSICLILFFTALIIGCSPIPSNEYVLFTPKSDSYFKVAFEYPNNWAWELPQENDRVVFSDWMRVSDSNGQLQTDNLGECYDGGMIQISVYVGDSENILKTEVQAINYGAYVTHVSEIISDEKIQIDGQPSRMIVSRQLPYKDAFCEGKAKITKSVFTPVEDRLYLFYFDAEESEQNSNFSKAFTHILDTVKIKP